MVLGPSASLRDDIGKVCSEARSCICITGASSLRGGGKTTKQSPRFMEIASSLQRTMPAHAPRNDGTTPNLIFQKRHEFLQTFFSGKINVIFFYKFPDLFRP